LKLVLSIKAEWYKELEEYLHQLYAERRKNGEWFDLTDQDLADIEKKHGSCIEAEQENLFYEEEMVSACTIEENTR